jgi:hypothetical protein
MSSTVKYVGAREGGEWPTFREYVGTCIAASTYDDDGNEVVDPEPINKRTLFRDGEFAFKAEAETWIAEQEAAGFEVRGPVPLATWRYHGPTDSVSNAWAAHAERPVE